MVTKKKTKPTKKKTTRKKPIEKPVLKSVIPEPAESENTKAEPGFDRIFRSGNSGKNAVCPKCGAFPTITKIRRPGYELRRCRECGHRFEIRIEG